jgi:hypothetical protein
MKIYDLIQDGYIYTFCQWDYKTKYMNKIYHGYIRWRYGNLDIYLTSDKDDLGKLIYCAPHEEFYDYDKYKNTIDNKIKKICRKISLRKVFKDNKTKIKGRYKNQMEYIQSLDKKYPELYNEYLRAMPKAFINDMTKTLIKMSIYDRIRGV